MIDRTWDACSIGARTRRTALAGLLMAGPVAAQVCTPDFVPTFGAFPGTSSEVRALESFDDGTGSRLYAGGSFRQAGSAVATSTPTLSLAQWDGGSWSPVGEPLSGGGIPVNMPVVASFAVYDDGGGAKLIVGGSFQQAGALIVGGIAAWDGTSWSSLGSGISTPDYPESFNALVVHDDGSGASLFAAGFFLEVSGVPAKSIARWNGTTWSPLGSGIEGTVRALAVYDDGSGAALYAAGTFTTAGGVGANRIARWNGASWSAVGGGLDGEARSLEVFDAGNGPRLYVGGSFTSAGGVPAAGIASWDGTAWQALGSGVAHLSAPATVASLQVHDDGSGSALFVGGTFDSVGGVPAACLAKWQGGTWSAVDGGLENDELHFGNASVSALASHGTASDGVLFVGGNFSVAGSEAANCAARWDGNRLSALETGLGGHVRDLIELNGTAGRELVVCGFFARIHGTRAIGVARWTPAGWESFGTGLPTAIPQVLAAYDDGSGPAVQVAGEFTTFGGTRANNVSEWNGSAWTALAQGTNGPIRELAVHDDGTGSALYAGGQFTSAGAIPAGNIARWDGASWSALAGGTVGRVLSLVSFDDGTGADLYAGGEFLTAGGLPASRIARWDGASWSALGSGTNGPVHDLAVFDDGSGEALYAVGSFTVAGGVGVNRIARWNGSTWSALGLPPLILPQELAVHDDGSGPALFVCGILANGGGATFGPGILRWDGVQWTIVSTGELASSVDALVSFDDGTGSALFVGGNFATSPAGDSYLAKYGCASPALPGFCFGDGGVSAGCTACPCGNDAPAGSGGGCLNSNSSGRGARLVASGVPNLSSPFDTLRFEVVDAATTTFGVLYSGDVRLPNSPANPCFGLASGVSSGLLDGLRCVGGALQRHGSRTTDAAGDIGATNAGWGGNSAPAAGIGASSGFSAGQTRHFQCTYRENVAVGCGTGLNTTNGVSVTFN